MQETASKFLFDHNSQGNLKFEEPMSFSPFNTRFSNNNFDLFINKLNVSNLEDNSIFLNNKSMNSIKPFSAMVNDKSHKNKQEDLTPIILNFKESSNVGSNKSTPVDSRPKTIILQASETSSSKKKKGKKKNQDEILLKEDDEKASKILKHPISKLRKSRQPPLRIEEEDTDSIYLRLYPHDLTTKSLMLKLNNFPRLEIKTSKKNYLKKVVDRLREKWLSKLNAQKDFKFDIIIRPDTENWLRHLDLISTKLNLPNDDSILTENYMLSDIWSGYNEPLSHKIDLYYQIKEVPKAREETAHSLNNNFKQEQPQPLKKSMTFMGLQVSQPKEQINFIKSEKAESNNKMEKLEKSDNILEHTGEKMNPYTGAEYFNMARRSASASRTSEKSNEGKSNGSSGFSFNEATGRDSNMRASTQANGPNDQSLRILYSQLNQQFPDETKFTSQLAKPGQVLSSVGTIKQIPVKRKV